MFSKGLPFCIDHLPGTSFAHEVHSLKKGHLSIKKYLAQIKGTCDLLEASSHPISTEEQVEFMLVGLSVEFDSILTPASFLTEPLKMD